ncbi:MAG: tetratricopeptide repeat protein [Thiotrichales bacterium]|nr:MAG: tetratricopeptide repeat protein [Thiotrichales bacterium]
MAFKSSILLSLLLGILCHPALADSIDKLPATWQQQLKPVPGVDLSPLKADEQTAILDGRARVNELLLQSSADTKPLATAYGKLGNLYLIHELLTSADACYTNAVQLQPDYFPWAYYYAYLAQKNGNLDTALNRYKKAMTLDPDYLPTKYRLAEVYLDLNRPDDAYTLFSALADNPEYTAAASYGLGQVYMLKQEHQKAIEYFSRALEMQPRATKIHYPLAMSLRATGQTEKAKEHLKLFGKQEIVIKDKLVDALQALRNPASRHFAAAMTAVIRKDYATADSEFSKGMEYEPDNTNARTSYARVLYLNKNKDEARTQLELVTTQDPDKSLALFLLAMLYNESGDMEPALELYQRVLALDPQHEGANFFLGNYYLHNKDYSKAIEHYRLAIISNEKNVPAMMFRLVAMMGNGSSDQDLLATVNTITTRAPGMFSMKRIQILLLALSDEDNVRDAELAIEQAGQMYKQHQYPANLELLAIATAAGGDFENAEKQLNHALSSEKQHRKSRNVTRMNDTLLLLQQGKLPELEWHEELSYMLPSPTNALSAFRDYPDANPI